MRLLLLLGVLGLALLARASHFMGGTISCEVTSLSSRTVKCSWFQGWRLTAGPCGGGCGSTSVGIYGTNSQGYWQFGGSNLATITYTVTTVNVPENWEQGSDSFSTSFSSDGPHEIKYSSCCWRALSHGSGSSMLIGTTIYLGVRSDTGAPNKPPQTMGKPIIRLQYQCPGVKELIPMIDSDLDSTQCRFGTAAECGSVSNILPHTSLKSKPGSCELTMDGKGSIFTTNGWYAGCITIEDFPRSPMTAGSRSFSTSTPISATPYQFMVYTPFINVACTSTPQWVSPPTPAAGVNIAAQVGVALSITIEAEPDKVSKAGITDVIFAGPAGGVPGAITSQGHKRRRTYTWTPTTTQKGSHNICFQATDAMTKTGEYRCVVVAVGLNCPDPGTPSGTSRVPAASGTFSFGQIVTYSCTTTGHVISSGSAVRTCQLNKQFDGTAPGCTLQNCGAPTVNTGVSKSGSVYTYGQTVTFSCISGYQYVSGTASRSCGISGAWSGSDYTCTRVSCSTLSAPANGAKTGNDFKFGGTVTFSCNTGYIMSGTSSLTCQANAQWSATAPTCAPVNCGALTAPTNGKLTSTGTSYLNTASFSCDSGYERDSGSASLSCTSSGTWSASPLNCKKITCPTIGTPTNGVKTGSSYRYQDQLSFSCNTGYERDAGSSQITCQANRAWSASALTCKKITCPSLTTPTNGQRTGSSFRYQDVVTFSCNSGYETDTGSTRVTCQANRAWTGSQLTCKRITCPTLSSPSNGAMSAPGFRYQDQVSFSCNTGYELDTGSFSVTCQANKQWSAAGATCKRITCPTPTRHNNATQTGSSYRYQDSVSWTCNTGYERDQGDYNIRCQHNRLWNGTALTCKRVTCPTLLPHNNATQTGFSYRYLDNIQWSCNTGYIRDTGVTGVQCQANRQWSGAQLTCKRVTCPSLTVSTNSTQTGNAFRYLDHVSWACHTGYERASGDFHVQCQPNGQWNGTTLTCKRITCPTLVAHNNATQTGSAFRYLDHVSWTCNTGYERSGGDYHVQCQANRQWNGTVLGCTRITCPTLAPHNNASQTGNSFRYLDHVSWACNTGYEPSGGDAHVMCQANRQWNGTVRQCKRITCPTLTPHNNATQTGSAFRYLDHVSWTCNTGYEPDTGDAHVQCQANRQWNGTVQTCKRITCPSLTRHNNATQRGSSFRYLDHLEWKCNTGYERDSGDHHIQCQHNRQWNGTVLQCKRITCPTLVSHNNATQTGQGFRYLDHVSWTCNTGYEPSGGDHHVQCQANRAWNGTTLSCTRITCPTLTPHNNATQTGSAFRYLDHVSWTCNTGYEPDTGDAHVQCQANRQWNGTVQTCKRITCPTLVPHNNATQTGFGFRYLDHVSWACNTGYEPDQGDHHVQCLANRSWNGTVLTCKRITCPTLLPHNNATQTGYAYRYLDHVSWSCNTGYEPDTGDAHVQCQANRQWNGTVRTCKRITCPTLTPHNNATQTGSAFRYLDHVSWSCNTGYEPDTGDHHVQCQANRQWNGTTLTCKRITCPTLVPHNNATQTGRAYRYLDHVAWSCNYGYERLAGDYHVMCQSNRAWNGTVLSCQRVNCSSPPHDPWIDAQPHVSVQLRYLDIATYQCKPGYKAVRGDFVRMCQGNSTLNGTDLGCVDINECQSHPCLNGAQCNNLVNGYTCTCTNGYTGFNCQTAPTLSASLQNLIGSQSIASLSGLTSVPSSAITALVGGQQSGASNLSVMSSLWVIMLLMAALKLI